MMALHEFEAQLVVLLPKMKIWALALTHNRTAADDLVQETAVKALVACDSFLAGTNMSAWIHRILLNAFISETRSRRFIADAEVPDQAIVSNQIDRIALGELALAMDLLPREQKAALVSLAVNERSYADVAQGLGCAIGTLKSRVHRARLQLRPHMDERRPLAA